MQITIGIWIMPVMLTIFIWLWFTWDSSGDPFGAMFEGFAALLVIAIMWAVYFAIRYFAATWGMP